MSISVIDSAPAMAHILDAPPERVDDLIRQLWAPLAGMYRFVPGDLDLAVIHRQSFGFAAPRTVEESGERHAALTRLREADAWNRVERALADATARLVDAHPRLELPDLRVLLILGDPADRHFMEELQGLSAFGGISGYISITLWPTPRVLARLEAIAVHELHHNVRYGPGGVAWNPDTVTVGEQVVAEGLADAFATELYGDAGATHFVAAETRSSDEVLDTVARGLGVTGMHNFASFILGDASARLFGGEPRGLPTGAGYAAGTRIVTAFLDEARMTAADAVRTPSADILQRALPRLGLPLTGRG